MGILEQLGIVPELILINIVGFILLLLLLKKFLYGPITQMLASRKDDIRYTYDEAERHRQAMEDMKKDWELRMQQIEAEANAKIQAAVKEAQSVRDGLVAEARDKAENIVQRGTDELGREKQKVVTMLRQEVANLAIGASAMLLGRSMDDETHRKLIDDFISSAGKAQ